MAAGSAAASDPASVANASAAIGAIMSAGADAAACSTAASFGWVLLALLEEQPRHGYDLIREIEERTGGSYAPSPGVVYPTLTMLDEMGHIDEVKEEGARKRFAITDAGKAFLEEKREEVDALLERLAAIGEHEGRSGRRRADPPRDDGSRHGAARHARRRARQSRPGPRRRRDHRRSRPQDRAARAVTRFIAVRPWPRLALAAANDTTPNPPPHRGGGGPAAGR